MSTRTTTPKRKALARPEDIPGIKRASEIAPALSVQGVARVLGVCEKTVRRMVLAGEFPPPDFRIGTGRRREHGRWWLATIEAHLKGGDA